VSGAAEPTPSAAHKQKYKYLQIQSNTISGETPSKYAFIINYCSSAYIQKIVSKINDTLEITFAGVINGMV